MRLVTWNVNSLKARLPRVLELLAELAPDVVCLQETKSSPEAFPVADLAAVGYGCAHHSGGRWAGVAIAYRQGLVAGEFTLGLPGERHPQEARWIEATLAGTRVISTYVPNGRSTEDPMFAAKLEFLAAAERRVRELGEAGGPIVLAGDVNVAPTDRDVYDPAAFVGSTHVTPGERDALADVLESGGLVDAFRVLHPDEPGFTWWDYRQGHFHRGLGLRIDLALVSRELAGRVRACGIARDYRKGSKPSDHAPLVVDLDG